ncbi:15787_t:CDS:2 [Dentiscutata erythropus]|uniref:15787_t:CDS:1 n=1 Tax=Dentiscutata erythropus TaxID=1348616 RepID=A0A9N9DBT6_9GLOM|nr:15787_t:CDS:2 [Dentiscutata erythropus]
MMFNIEVQTNYRLCRVLNFDRAIASEKLTSNIKDINSLILRFGDDLVFSHQGRDGIIIPGLTRR